MHTKTCPHCQSLRIHRHGYYRVRVLQAYRRRYRCLDCGRSFSTQTTTPTYRQKRPDLNEKIRRLLVSGMPQRGIARYLQCSKNTVDGRLIWLTNVTSTNSLPLASPSVLYLDEMESIEHTKLKPLSVPIVIGDDYRLYGVEVARIAAKGHLADISRRKYGPRPSQREQALTKLFETLSSQFSSPPQVIVSDAAPIYRTLVQRYFPNTPHRTFVARALNEKKREMPFLKGHKAQYDPIFPLNHSFARFRQDLRRLSRRSWCTTKKPENLKRHLSLLLASQ